MSWRFSCSWPAAFREDWVAFSTMVSSRVDVTLRVKNTDRISSTEPTKHTNATSVGISSECRWR